MLRLFILVMYVILSASVVAETVYKKINPDGSVEFTDKGSQDSEEIKVRKPTTYIAPRLPRFRESKKKLRRSYNYSPVITQPTEDSIIIGKSNVTVSVSLSSNLHSKHKIRYQLGAQSTVNRNTTVTFQNIDRGSHQLSVSIINSQGEVVGSAAPVTFHVKRFFKK